MKTAEELKAINETISQLRAQIEGLEEQLDDMSDKIQAHEMAILSLQEENKKNKPTKRS